jgi:small subunit ribosomal protein S7
MARRRRAVKREILPDAKFGHIIITKFINYLMYDGNKSVAEKVFYAALTSAAEKVGEDPVEFFEGVLENIRPTIEVRSRRVGGATYQVPTNVRPERQTALAIRWLITAAKSRKDAKNMESKLEKELLDARSNKGGAFKKKEDTFKMAESNRAFAHFNW